MTDPLRSALETLLGAIDTNMRIYGRVPTYALKDAMESARAALLSECEGGGERARSTETEGGERVKALEAVLVRVVRVHGHSNNDTDCPACADAHDLVPQINTLAPSPPLGKRNPKSTLCQGCRHTLLPRKDGSWLCSANGARVGTVYSCGLYAPSPSPEPRQDPASVTLHGWDAAPAPRQGEPGEEEPPDPLDLCHGCGHFRSNHDGPCDYPVSNHTCGCADFWEPPRLGLRREGGPPEGEWKCGHGCRAHYWDGHICQSLDGEKHACGCDWVEPSSPPEPEGGGRAKDLKADLSIYKGALDDQIRRTTTAEARVRELEQALRDRSYHAPGECPHVGQASYFGYGPNRDRCMMECAELSPASRPTKVLERLADPDADWEQAKADLRTILTEPVNGPAPEEAATLPKRALRPLTGDALKDACRRLSPPPALEDMDIATPEEAATGTCQKCDGTTLVIDSAGEPADCTACNNGRAPVLRREGERTGIRREGGPPEGQGEEREARCPQCNYTWRDVHELMDHRFCDGPGPAGPDTYAGAKASKEE